MFYDEPVIPESLLPLRPSYQTTGKEIKMAEEMLQTISQDEIEIALKLKRAKALSNEDISQFTGLSLSEVEELQ